MITCKWLYMSAFFIAAFGANAQTTKTTTGTTDISVLPVPGPNMSDVVIDSNLTLNGSDTTILDIYPYCYGTNLRSVANPVSPAANIKATILYTASDNSTKRFEITFPAGAAMTSSSLNQDLTSESKVFSETGTTVTEILTARLRDSLIRVSMKKTKTVGLDVLASGTDYGALGNSGDKTNLFKTINFTQIMPANATPQQYMGWNGPLSASVRWYFSENGKHATVYAGFPGQNGFCGGYFSPLMLKFGELDVHPEIKGTSHFSLTEKARLGKIAQKISWPSFLPKEDIYFLALDRNENGIIDDGSELFGDVNGFENGFANLAVYDLNKDGVIDEKDPVFKKLVLWSDKNHDGVCKKSEVIPLSKKGIVSISLAFDNVMRQVGHSGKLLGPGEFTYKNKKGVEVKGKVWDVFMNLAPE